MSQIDSTPRVAALSRRLLAVFCLFAMCGCTSVIAIRVENTSTIDFTDVSVAGQPYGDIGVGATSEYQNVQLNFRYALIKLTADGHKVNAQTLNLRAKRFTHRIDIIDLAAGHLAVEIIRE